MRGLFLNRVRLPFDCAQGTPSENRGVKGDPTSVRRSRARLLFDVVLDLAVTDGDHAVRVGGDVGSWVTRMMVLPPS